jgi:hypothetical protein
VTGRAKPPETLAATHTADPLRIPSFQTGRRRAVMSGNLQLQLLTQAASSAVSLPMPHVKRLLAGCGICGVPFLCTLQPDGELRCSVCVSGLHNATTVDTNVCRPVALSTPAATTDDAIRLWAALQQWYADKDSFMEGVTAAVASAGNRGVKRCKQSNSNYIYMGCVNASCKFVVKGKKSKGLWTLCAKKAQVWDHDAGCPSSVCVWPNMRVLAANPRVRSLILAQQSQKSMEKDVDQAAFVRNVESAGFSFPQRASDSTERQRKDRLRHLLKRVTDKVLGRGARPKPPNDGLHAASSDAGFAAARRRGPALCVRRDRRQ